MIKTYYITDVLGKCRVVCPHGESCKVGSIKCKRSKCCLESSDGDITAINDWIICKKDQPEEVEKSCDNCRYLDEDDDCRSDISCDDVLWAGWKPKREELCICDHAEVCEEVKCPHIKKHVYNLMCVRPACRYGESKCIPYKEKEKPENKCPMFKKYYNECDHCTPLGVCSFKYEKCAHVKAIKQKEKPVEKEYEVVNPFTLAEIINNLASTHKSLWDHLKILQNRYYGHYQVFKALTDDIIFKPGSIAYWMVEKYPGFKDILISGGFIREKIQRCEHEGCFGYHSERENRCGVRLIAGVDQNIKNCKFNKDKA